MSKNSDTYATQHYTQLATRNWYIILRIPPSIEILPIIPPTVTVATSRYDKDVYFNIQKRAATPSSLFTL